jgi:hypothetical protein
VFPLRYELDSYTLFRRNPIFPSEQKKKALTCLEENNNLGHRSRRDLKPRITVLAKISSNLTDRTVFPVLSRFPVVFLGPRANAELVPKFHNFVLM